MAIPRPRGRGLIEAGQGEPLTGDDSVIPRPRGRGLIEAPNPNAHPHDKADVAETGVLQRGLPGALDDADRAVAETDDETRILAVFEQMLVQPFGQGDLAGFSFRGFGAGD